MHGVGEVLGEAVRLGCVILCVRRVEVGRSI